MDSDSLQPQSKNGSNFFQSAKHRIYTLLAPRIRARSVATRPLQSQETPGNYGRVEVLHASETLPLSAYNEVISTWGPGNQPNPHSPAGMGELSRQIALPTALRLPLEILQEIFYFAKHEDRFLVDNIGFSFRGAKELPWEISQVCQQWRYAAFSTPFLWATLPDVNLRLEHTSRKDYLFGLADILGRSRDALVTVHVSGVTFRDRTHPAADLLVRHSKRWQKITLQIPLDGFRAFLGATGKIPALRTLRADWTEISPTHYGSNDIFDLFLNAPQLQNVKVMKGRTGELLLPHTGFLKYEQFLGHGDAVHQILCCSPGLRYLELIRVEFGPGIHTHNFHFRHLVFLRIHAVASGLLRWLFDSISAPVLEELRVDAFPDEITPAITAMISRSVPPPPIQKLHLRTAFNSPGQLANLLLLTPSLTLLNVTMPLSSDIMALTSPGANGSMLAPILQDCLFESMRDTSPEQIRQAAFFTKARSGLRFTLK
ncbi:hypothetical protein GALMADRAFT_153425 [Galerina marginata CBS 339.88]|uniref:Uncharacterized protein n=1 Tax=Galerina marginata (strain CBS 339.88) TaxID=685588 RepID=A0A067TQ25_GALM3|nr:hypothetical protein GALMADRAFT_153425 [Galerina marginata CBS 339.88]